MTYHKAWTGSVPLCPLMFSCSNWIKVIQMFMLISWKENPLCKWLQVIGKIVLYFSCGKRSVPIHAWQILSYAGNLAITLTSQRVRNLPAPTFMMFTYCPFRPEGHTHDFESRVARETPATQIALLFPSLLRLFPAKDKRKESKRCL